MKRQAWPILLLFVFLLFNKEAISQPYQKMLGTSNEWYLYQLEGTGWTCLWETASDTTIGFYSYKKVNIGLDFAFACRLEKGGYIREDTLSKKIYYINCEEGPSIWCDTLEMLLYDFSKIPGDTVIVQGTYSYTPTGYATDSLILDSITIDTSLSPNRIFHLHKINNAFDPQKTWIEGIGSLAGLENNLLPWQYGSGAHTLLCAFKDSIQTFHFRSFFIPGEDTCIYERVIGVKEAIFPFIKISPNPATDNLFVSISNTQYNLQSIHLTDLSGKTILEPRETTIPLKSIAKGLYFVSVHLTNGESVVKKVVVE